MRAEKEGKCPLCRRHERYTTEMSLYTCPNPKCKLSEFWFSPDEWSRLCRTARSRYGTEKAEAVPEADQSAQPLEMVTLRDRFAMAALTGLYANSGKNGTPGLYELAYEIADGVIAHRKKQEVE